MFSIFRDNRDDLQDLSRFPVIERTSFQLYHSLNYDSTSFINLAQLIPLQVTRLGRTMRPCWGLLEKKMLTISMLRWLYWRNDWCNKSLSAFQLSANKEKAWHGFCGINWNHSSPARIGCKAIQDPPFPQYLIHWYPFISIESGCNDALRDLVKCFAHDYTTLVSIRIPKHWPLGRRVSVSAKSKWAKERKTLI